MTLTAVISPLLPPSGASSACIMPPYHENHDDLSFASPSKSACSPLSPSAHSPGGKASHIALTTLTTIGTTTPPSNKKTEQPLFPKRGDFRRVIVAPHATTDGFFIHQRREEDKQAGSYHPRDVIAHAFLRIQLFALEVVAYYATGLRSDLSKRPVAFDVGPAYLQIGQGSKDYPAAHQNANAGRVDNMRSSLIADIIATGLTPSKARILRCKQFDEDQMGEMENLDPEKINEIFDKVWPADKKKPPSLLEGTRLNYTLNSTSELPQALNLACDKGLEYFLRPKTVELYQQIIYAEMSREELCQKYCQLINSYFDTIEVHISERIALLEVYAKKLSDFNELPKSEAPTQDELQKLKTALIDLQKTFFQINIPKKDDVESQENEEATTEELPKIGLTSSPKKVISSAKLRTNKNFLNRSFYNLSKNNDDTICSIKTLLAEKYDVLKEEVVYQTERFKKYLTFCKLEKEGTEVPDFTSLFGTFNQETGKRDLTEEDYSQLQERLLKTKTPQSTPTASPSSTPIRDSNSRRVNASLPETSPSSKRSSDPDLPKSPSKRIALPPKSLFF